MSQPNSKEHHNQTTVDQFTRQAIPFSQLHRDDDSVELLARLAGISPTDTVLDVGCGPGLVACGVAPAAGHVTGIDLTPAMIEQAKKLQHERQLTNVDWYIGDVSHLPFAAAAFKVSLSRYTFHHLADPKSVFAEMVRVTAPGGRIVVADVFTTNAAAARGFNHLEQQRDPSHTRALDLEEFKKMFTDAGLTEVRTTFYKFHTYVDALLSRSFPPPGGADEFRKIVRADVEKNALGLDAGEDATGLHFNFPVVAVEGVKV